ncbi:MAG: Kef family K(+) transporter [Burkholderiaceae bacterium]|nr:Kef family K(+) transporter [Burkholderiaceae bacterium]
MDHHIPLITTLAAAFTLALAFGTLAVRLKMPALVGYLLAGVAIGPFTPGFVADAGLATELAEIGVMLLMFGVGLHFSIDDLMAVRKIAVPGAVLQIAVATALGVALATGWGWDLAAGLIFGLSLSVASTVVLLRALEARGMLDSMNGRIAVGWLVVEDLVMVLVLVLLPAVGELMAGTGGSGGGSVGTGGNAHGALLATLGSALLKVALFIGLMLAVGRKLLPRLLWLVAQTGSRELFRLCVVAAAIGIAVGAAQLFGVSFALGAFFAGMVLRESEFSQQAAEESLPLRDAFAVLFFVSVGMLFDPRVLVEQPLQVLAVVAIIMLGKSLAAALLVLAFRYPLNTSLIVSASLAQIGEFSFILAGLGVALGLMPEAGRTLVLAGAIVSIALNPLLFAAIEPLRRWMQERSPLARRLASSADALGELPMSTEEKYLSGQTVLVGWGRVGRRIAEALDTHGIPYVVVERNRELVERLRADGKAAVAGDGGDAMALIQAHIARAALLVIAVPDTVDVRAALGCAQQLNPALQVMVRLHSEDEARLLADQVNGRIFLGEAELARGMIAEVLQRYGLQDQRRSAMNT